MTVWRRDSRWFAGVTPDGTRQVSDQRRYPLLDIVKFRRGDSEVVALVA
jgi:hypothetical protein